jgi:hypothetical protein
MLKIRLNPINIPVPSSRRDGLGRAIAIAGNKKSAAWMNAIVSILIRFANKNRRLSTGRVFGIEHYAMEENVSLEEQVGDGNARMRVTQSD